MQGTKQAISVKQLDKHSAQVHLTSSCLIHTDFGGRRKEKIQPLYSMDHTESNSYKENYCSYLGEPAISSALNEISNMNKLVSDQYSNFY